MNKVPMTVRGAEKLREELLHLASVCLSWANSIEMRETGRFEDRAA